MSLANQKSLRYTKISATFIEKELCDINDNNNCNSLTKGNAAYNLCFEPWFINSFNIYTEIL